MMMNNTSLSESHSLLNGSQTSGYNSIRSVVENDQSDDDADSVYTELLQGSVPCPTCRGIGKIPKEQEGQLVALIPMKDKRLRPRRTYLWVCLAVVLCMTAAGLVMFFLFPRSVDLISKKPYLNPVGPVYINVTDQYVSFIIQNRFNISNQNYVPIKILSVTMSVQYDTQVLAQGKNASNLYVPMRSRGQYYINANVTLNQANQMGYMARSCEDPVRWAHEMVLRFESYFDVNPLPHRNAFLRLLHQTTFENIVAKFNTDYEVLGHTSQATLQTFQFVSCYSAIKPSTIGPTPKPTTSNVTSSTTTTRTPR